MPTVLRPARLIALGSAAAAALAVAGTAQAERVAVIVVPRFEPATYGGRGAVGLMPPGDGTTVSRRAALAALVRGKVRKSVLGGVPGGEPKITLARRPAQITMYVSLPPPGTHPNDVRYPVAVVGAGYRGILESPSTRIPGLVSIADIAPTALALERGKKPRIGWTDGTPRDVEELDARLDRQEESRNPAVAILACSALAFGLIGLALASPALARAGLLAAPLALAAAVALDGAGVTRPAVLLPLLAASTLALAALGGALLRGRALAAGFTSLILAYLVVLVAEPTWPALAAVGPNPSEGGRFYGCSNLTTSVVLTVTLFAVATFGLRGLVPVAALALVTVGWSKAGADGGGLIVLAAAGAALAVRLVTGRLTVRALSLAAAAAVLVGLALVGLDAATGGRSHVTRRVGDGPFALAGELGSRLHISVERLAASWHAALVFAVAIAALLLLASRRPRFASGDALLVGIAVSLLVNDTPQHVASAGAISYGVLWVAERVHGQAGRAAH